MLGVSYMEADGPSCTERFGTHSAYSDAVGDLALIDEKYGPSIGLGQVRALRNPRIWGTADRFRVARLLRDPWFNAVACFWISKNGTDFTPWTMYRNGMFTPYRGNDYATMIGHPNADKWDS
jgi:hypothetical protein